LPAEESNEHHDRLRIFLLLRDMPLTIDQLADKAKMPKKDVDRHLGKLIEGKHIIEAKGLYEVNPDWP